MRGRSPENQRQGGGRNKILETLPLLSRSTVCSNLSRSSSQFLKTSKTADRDDETVDLPENQHADDVLFEVLQGCHNAAAA